MPKAYCQDCFLATEYSGSPAKFCVHCGQSLIGGVVVKPAPKKIERVVVEQDNSPEDDDETSASEDNTPIPQVNDMGIKVSYSKPRGEKVSSLAKGNGGQTRVNQDSSQIKQKPLSKKQILAEFQKEAGSLRPKKNR